jgi:heme/copper-type cytochrome/quinol oxidase subunit 2
VVFEKNKKFLTILIYQNMKQIMLTLKKHWWAFHFLLFLIWLILFLVFSVWGGLELLSNPSSDQKETFSKILSIIYSIYFITLFYPVVLIFSAFRNRKTHSYRVIGFVTGVTIVLILSLFAFYLEEKNKYREISKMEVNSIITPDDTINDYICPEERGNLAFLKLNETTGIIGYTGVRENGLWFSSELDEVTTTNKTFYSIDSLGVNYQWKSYADKYDYVSKCLNKEGKSILEKYTFQPPLYGVVYRSDTILNADGLDVVYTLEFSNSNKAVTFDSHYPKSKSPYPRKGTWDFTDDGRIVINFETEGNGYYSGSVLFLQLKKDAVMVGKNKITDEIGFVDVAGIETVTFKKVK